jgi:hypothetical protein
MWLAHSQCDQMSLGKKCPKCSPIHLLQNKKNIPRKKVGQKLGLLPENIENVYVNSLQVGENSPNPVTRLTHNVGDIWKEKKIFRAKLRSSHIKDVYIFWWVLLPSMYVGMYYFQGKYILGLSSLLEWHFPSYDRFNEQNYKCNFEQHYKCNF